MTSPSAENLKSNGSTAVFDQQTPKAPWTNPELQASADIFREIREVRLQKQRAEAKEKDLLGKLTALHGMGALSEFQDLEPGRYVYENCQITQRTRRKFVPIPEVQQMLDANKAARQLIESDARDNEMGTYEESQYWVVAIDG